jgi:hypothetical protein
MSDKDYIPKLKVLISSQATWEAFTDMIDSHVEMMRRKMEQTDVATDLYRAQGAIAALKQLKYLKEEILNVQKSNQ